MYICPRCKQSDYECIGGLEDEGGGNLRDDYKCNTCGKRWTSDDTYIERTD